MYVSTLFLTVVSGLAATVAANYTEYVSNYTFTHWGPTWDASKFDYELSMAKEAINLFKARLGADGYNLTVPETTADLPQALAQLKTTKDNLGPEGLVSLFKQDIADADKYWHDAIANSDGTTWKPTDGHCICFIPSLSAASFGLWSTSAAADAVNNDVNPEHYIKKTSTGANGLPTSNILEGWGGVTTHFDIMNFTVPDHIKYPFLRQLPDYPIQAAGPKVLKDGTTFGVLHLAVKDVDDAKYGKGFEVFSTIWYQSGVTEEHIEAEREHMINEIVKLSVYAAKDSKSGVKARQFAS